MKQFLLKLVKILPLILIFEWDYTLSTDPTITTTGFIIRASRTPGGPYSNLITSSDPNARTVTEGTLTSGETRCYIAVATGLIDGVPNQSLSENEICVTNTVDPPLRGPGGGKGGVPVFR